MSGQPFLFGQILDILGDGIQCRLAEIDHATTAKEIVGTQTRCPAGGAAGGQHVAWPGGVIP